MDIKDFGNGLALGMDIQTVLSAGGEMTIDWRDIDVRETCHIAADDPTLLRFKPTLKPVDMSVLIDSGIGVSDNKC